MNEFILFELGLRSRRRKEKVRKKQIPQDDYMPQNREIMQMPCVNEDVSYGNWARSECFKVEKGLLSFGYIN